MLIKILHWLQKNYQFTIIVVIIIGVAVFLTVTLRTDPGAEELSNAKSAVSQHMLLPQDEEPTLAVVEDKTQLKDKILAANAENGDQILIYTNNKLAIIYRPKIDRIVSVSPVTVDQAVAEADGASITLVNGTDDANITAQIEQQIKAVYPDIKISKRDANRRDFPKTVVIDHTDTKDYLLDSLVSILKGTRGVVPLSEDKSSTDLMILIGSESLAK